MFARLRKDFLVAVDLAELLTPRVAQSQVSKPPFPHQVVASSPKKTPALHHADRTPSSSSRHPLRPSFACLISKHFSKTAPTFPQTTRLSPNLPVPTALRSPASSIPSMIHPRPVPRTNHRPRAAAPSSFSSTARPISNLNTGTMSSPYSRRVRHGSSNHTSGHRRQSCSSMQRVSMWVGEEKMFPGTSRVGVVVCAHSRWKGGTRKARM